MYRVTIKQLCTLMVILVLIFESNNVAAQLYQNDSITSNSDATKKDTISRKRRLPVIPFIFYTPETSLGFTINFARNFKNGQSDLNRTSSVLLTALYTLNNQWAIRGNYKGYYGDIGWVTFNSFSFGEDNGYFYGIGPLAADEHEEYFKSLEFRYQHSGLKRIANSIFYLGYGLKLQYIDYEKSENSELINNFESGLCGAEGGWNNGIGLSFMIDTRNELAHKLADSTLIHIHNKDKALDIHTDRLYGVLIDIKSTIKGITETHKVYRETTGLDKLVKPLTIEQKEEYEKYWRDISENIKNTSQALKILRNDPSKE